MNSYQQDPQHMENMDLYSRILQAFHGAWQLLNEPLQVALRPLLRREREDLCDLEVFLDDDSTADSTVSANSLEEFRDTAWGVKNDLRGSESHLPNSWTIFIHDRNHQAGDTVWFRIWNNSESNEFRECEDTEMVAFVQKAIMRYPKSCFYVKTVDSKGHESSTLFEASLIERALTAVLTLANIRNGIAIPKKEDLVNQVPTLERKEKRHFFTSLRLVVSGRSTEKR